MKIKYFVELYYYKKDITGEGLQETPQLDNYMLDTTMTAIIATSWDNAKEKILKKYPKTAYIYVHETRNLDI